MPSTIEDIQARVNDAQEKISQGVFTEQQQKNSWRAIRSMINEYEDLNPNGKMQLETLIHGRLDALGLEKGGKRVVIKVEDLIDHIQRHQVDPDSQDSIPYWYPW